MSLSVFITCALMVTLFNVNQYEAAAATTTTTTTTTTTEPPILYNYFGELLLPLYQGNASLIPFCEFFAEQEDAGTLYLKHRMLYIDIFSMAAGFRHLLPDSESVAVNVIRDRETQLIAQASVSIWSRLRYIEGMDRIFQNASWTTLVNIYKRSSTITNHVLHHARNEMFKTLETSILANATFKNLYQETKKRFEKRNVPPSRTVNYTMGRIPEISAEDYDDFPRSVLYGLKLIILDNRFSRCLYDVIQRNSTYNTHLTIQMNFTDPKVLQTQAVSEAILRWAKTNKVDRTQWILDDAIQYTRVAYPMEVQDMKQFMDTFFDKLDKDFRANSEFKGELEAIKDDLKKKYLQKH